MRLDIREVGSLLVDILFPTLEIQESSLRPEKAEKVTAAKFAHQPRGYRHIWAEFALG